SDDPPPDTPSSTPEVDRESPDEEAEFEESNPNSSSANGLWGMMGVAPTPASQSAPNDLPDTSDTENEDETEAPAWFRGKLETETDGESNSEVYDEDEDSAWDETPEDDDQDPGPEQEIDEEPPYHAQPSPVVTAPQSSAVSKHISLTKKTGLSRGALLSVAVGLLAVPLTLLAARPEIWTRMPATATGFGALVLGLISFNEIQRSRGQRTGKGFAMAGMVLGTIAMFLGPMVVAPWSQRQNKAGQRQLTKDHLEAMGNALRDYHAQHDHYPPGGTYRVEESGESTPMHSWMTDLLPYLGNDAVYQGIQRDEPWSAPVNKPAFSQSIPAFLGGGVEQTHNKTGYGLSHFAGLGGTMEVNGGAMANVGIFNRSSQVTQQDISDGMSQTLVAGEIPEGYRPWGEPGNWREIRAGLNQDNTSFGNAQRTGAMFLKADGSVQFLSNQVSLEILKSLSTRDGDDNRLIPERYR
ncbi:MAG: DUF1559 domain-containing protein, partial [Planctomycetaceae bacterium]|nr:DUF1559 domain-containing protein [Planctomycetaceae bacterium]